MGQSGGGHKTKWGVDPWTVMRQVKMVEGINRTGKKRKGRTHLTGKPTGHDPYGHCPFWYVDRT